MRRYIRHPSDIPIEFDLDLQGIHQQEVLSNVSLGGLSFVAHQQISLGTVLKVKIPFVNPAFEAHGKVVWCETWDDYYELGVELIDSDEAYRARMVEQVCHIEHYKREVWMREGRRLSGEEAAQEWISKYAAAFPNIHELEPH